MNILVVNWTWYPSGGDWTYIENICALYKENGHQIVPFSMKNPVNIPNDYQQYFIENIDYKELNQKNKLSTGVQVLTKSIYSFEAIEKLKELLKVVKIDLAHLNIIHRYITPSILLVLKKAGIPIVWTLHDYTVLCPESTFISNGQICESCKGAKFYNAAFKKCKKKSFLASSVASLDNYVHHYLDYYKYVDYFICPSKFHYDKFKEFGIFTDRLHQVYHSYPVEKAFSNLSVEGPKTERYIFFVGRLEKIKGVYTLLKAMLNCSDISLKIAGYGSQEVELRQFAADNQLQNVSFLGKQSKTEVLNLISQSEFLVCPSEWYEVLGFTIIEAMLMGKPVIGSRIGAIPETVIHEQTGLLFDAGNAGMLAQHIQSLYNSTDQILRLGNNAREHVLKLTNPGNHYKELQRIIPKLRIKDQSQKL